MSVNEKSVKEGLKEAGMGVDGFGGVGGVGSGMCGWDGRYSETFLRRGLVGVDVWFY